MISMTYQRKSRSLCRQDVIAAALACLAEGETLSLHAVARALAIKTPSLYNHIQGLEDLQQALALEGWRQFADALEQPGPELTLPEAVRVYRHFALSRPALYALMFRVTLDAADPEGAAVTQRIFERFGYLLNPVLADKQDLLHALRALRALMHGFVSLEAAGQFRIGGISAETSLEWALNGLEAWLRGASMQSGCVAPTGPEPKAG